MRPRVGWVGEYPLQRPGQRNGPPMALPCAIAPMPAATAAPAPPDDPPQVMSGSHGFSVSPCSGLSVKPRNENSGVLVSPTIIAPAFLRLRTTGASEGAMIFFCAGTPLGLDLPS